MLSGGLLCGIEASGGLSWRAELIGGKLRVVGLSGGSSCGIEFSGGLSCGKPPGRLPGRFPEASGKLSGKPSGKASGKQSAYVIFFKNMYFH